MRVRRTILIHDPASDGRIAARARRCTRTLATACLLCTIHAGAPHAAEAPVFRDGEGDISIALTGDSIITRRLSVHGEPEFLELRDLIRDATAAFTNLEVLFHDYGDDLIPAAESGGTYMQADPALADELAWMGFDMVSRANNHAMDFGAGGLRVTSRALDEAGLMHAGVGENLALARRPGYLETPGGRVALLSVASTFPNGAAARAQRADMRGRPGLSPVHFGSLHLIPADRLQMLRELDDRLRLSWDEGDDHLRIGDDVFAAGAEWKRVTRIYREDLEAVTEAVKDAARQANWVVVSSHTHESGEDSRQPPQALVELAHAVIDAGADVVVGHGPHILRGIEIYRGRPVFYSLGNFIFQNETVALQPQDNYERFRLGPDALPGEFQDARIEATGGGFPARPEIWESIAAVAEFRKGELHEIRLYPVTLGHGLERPQRGRPMRAGKTQSNRIVGELRDLSAAFGTAVESDEDGYGVIRP